MAIKPVLMTGKMQSKGQIRDFSKDKSVGLGRAGETEEIIVQINQIHTPGSLEE